MALFRQFRGNRASLDAQPLTDGYAYFCIDDGTFHIDYADENGVLHRKQINAKDAETLCGLSLDELKKEIAAQDVAVLAEAQAYADAAVANSADAVKYTEQTLTEEQQAQARANIGAGQPIIDVLTLPADNIDANAFYRSKTANFVTNNKIVNGNTTIIYVDALPETGLSVMGLDDNLCWYYNTSDGVVYSYIDETMSEMASSEFGITVPVGWYPFNTLYEMGGIYCDMAIILVDALPEQGLPAMDLNSDGMCLYYNASDNIVYCYITNTLSEVIASELSMTVPSGWHPFDNFTGLLGANYGGVITSMDDAVDADAIYILLSSVLYSYNNQWEPVSKKQIQVDFLQTDSTQPDYIINNPLTYDRKIKPQYLYQPDWSVTDESRPDAIKNKPFGDIKQGTIAYDGMVSCTSSFVGRYQTYGTYLSGNARLLNGVAYKVVLNGEEWDEIVAENNRLQYDQNTYFGQSNFDLLGYQLDGEYHLRIVVAKDSSYQIDPKYLPSSLGIGKNGSGGNAEIFNDYFNNEASGYCSHAEGNNTTASGYYSHAEGSNTTASGGFSHAEGSDTTASYDCSHAEGRYNIEDTENTYAHIVGNGTSTSKRSNAHTLDWNGNAWFQGNVYVGGTGQDDVTAKRLLTEDDMLASSLPETTAADNGKLLQVVDGKWSAADYSSLPDTTAEDNNKVLTVVNGEASWELPMDGISVTDDGEGNVEITTAAHEGGSGLRQGQIDALYGLLKIAAYTEDATEAHAAFLRAFGIGSNEPDVPIEPIFVAYSPKTPNGLRVNFDYDTDDADAIRDWLTVTDESGNTITDYTLSKNADGDVMVYYHGATATVEVERNTFTVIGATDFKSGSTNKKYSSNGAGSPYTEFTSYYKVVYPYFITAKAGYSYTFAVKLTDDYYVDNADRANPRIVVEWYNTNTMDCVASHTDYAKYGDESTGWQAVPENLVYTYTPQATADGHPLSAFRFVLQRPDGDNHLISAGDFESVTITATPVAS